MTFKHQSPFREGEVPEILQKLHDSERRRHSEEVVLRDTLRAQFGRDWFVDVSVADAVADDADAALAALDAMLTQHDRGNTSPSLLPKTGIGGGEPSTPERGLFAGEPSYPPSYSEPYPEDWEGSLSESHCSHQATFGQADDAGSGVNAKTGNSKQSGQPLSTPVRAGLVAKFHLSHAERVVAISKLHADLEHHQLEKLLKIDAYIQNLMRSYQGSGELPDWAKFVSAEMKQYFRLHLLCTKTDAKTITIRLDHDSAEAALAASRGPANYVAEIIKRTLTKLGIQTDLAFNLEFNHTGSTENHPLHIHGALCIPGGRVKEVTEALRSALAEGYRQRYNNAAVHIQTPRSAQWWAAYCIKEYGTTAGRLACERGLKSRPDYAGQKLAKDAKAFYEGINAWLNS